MAKGNPNPVTKFKKGHKKVAGRPPGQPNYLTADIRKLIRQAAEETGFITTVPVLDAEGKPTGQFEEKMIEEGEKGYLSVSLDDGGAAPRQRRAADSVAQRQGKPSLPLTYGLRLISHN